MSRNSFFNWLPADMQVVRASSLVSWRQLPWLVIWKLSSERIVKGVRVRVFADSTISARLYVKVGLGMALIADNDHVRLHKIQRDLKGILVTSANDSAYIDELRICRLSVAQVSRASPVQLAMTIVHESTHARIARIGCPYAGKLREAIEKACVASEVAFARKAGGSEMEINRVVDMLRTQWWTDRALVARQLDGLVRSGWPQWLVKLIQRMGIFP